MYTRGYPDDVLNRAMLHNFEDYPEPEKFKPERFIKDGKINSEIRDPLTIAFGFGRRYVSPLLPIHQVRPSSLQSVPWSLP